ncbi:pilus assembly protein TadG-related protein [Streptomyces erythrochromogenes]|uniref:pilus assembly protein TadG-related protein n=1 Tax=Streptomyces erythrochromogenes TaxID=285574 RepID=UPI0033F4FB3C
MIAHERLRDRGQAFPIYVLVVAGLLFAALAFFAVGQASVTRSNAQGAADAAALAAAREARDNLVPGLDLSALKPEDWEEVLDGGSLYLANGCSAASGFAAKNDATARCTRVALSFTVEVRTNGTVGESVIPGTDSMHGTANATAVIEPRCYLGSLAAPTPPADPPTTGSEEPAPIKIRCKGGKDIDFDPLKANPWRTLARVLFNVRLAD